MRGCGGRCLRGLRCTRLRQSRIDRGRLVVGLRRQRLVALLTGSTVVRLHEVDKPILVGLRPAARTGVDQRELARATQPALFRAVQRGDDLFAVAPLLEVVDALVPDLDRAAAVLALRNGAGERAVLERMVFCLHGEVVDLGLGGRALGQRPRHEHPVVLEPEVVVQPRTPRASE